MSSIHVPLLTAVYKKWISGYKSASLSYVDITERVPYLIFCRPEEKHLKSSSSFFFIQPKDDDYSHLYILRFFCVWYMQIKIRIPPPPPTSSHCWFHLIWNGGPAARQNRFKFKLFNRPLNSIYKRTVWFDDICDRIRFQLFAVDGVCLWKSSWYTPTVDIGSNRWTGGDCLKSHWLWVWRWVFCVRVYWLAVELATFRGWAGGVDVSRMK